MGSMCFGSSPATIAKIGTLFRAMILGHFARFRSAT